MSYLVLARKYRPQTFTEVVGQEPIVTTLTNAIRQKRIGQAYLFSGPRGTGKTSTARIFAKGLNCLQGPTPTPCLKCKTCEEIAEGRSLDVLEIDGASNRGIDQIRTLRELAKFSPSVGPFKVYLIDEVHQITAEGFNALLKTLEEPPPHLLFILATTAPHKVPATILSRCQRFEFRRLPLKLIAEKLRAVAAEERFQIAEEAVLGIARAASGSLRDAESILDQVAAFSAGPIRSEDLRVLLGKVNEDLFAETMAALRQRESVRLLKQIAEVTDAGTDLIQWSLSLLGFVRNLLVAKVGAGSLGFEDLEPEAVQRLTKLAQQFSVEELTGIAQALTGAVETMRRVGDPRIPLEMVLVRLASTESLASVAELVSRLERLDQRWREEPTNPKPVAPATPTPNALEGIVSVWGKLLESLHQERASTAAYLGQGSPVSLEEGDPPQLVVGFPKGCEFHCEALSQMETRKLIDQLLESLLGRPVRCSFKVVDQIPKRPPEGQESNLPFLNSVLELFEGRILPGEG